MLIEGKADSVTKERLSKLASAVLSVLESQTPVANAGTVTKS